MKHLIIFEKFNYKYSKGEYVLSKNKVYKILKLFTLNPFSKMPRGVTNSEPYYCVGEVIDIKDPNPIISRQDFYIPESDIDKKISLNNINLYLSSNKYNL